MRTRRTITLVVGVVALAFVVTLAVYPRLPDRVASHWNAAGRADGWTSKGVGVFLLPFTMVGLAALLMAIPAIDPLKRNVDQFRAHYDGFIVLFLLFLLVLQLHILLWNLGTQINPNRLLPIPFGVLIYYSGVLIAHAKRNWFIGVRTPWTLSSDRVWDQTHRVTGRLFKICGAASVVGLAFEDRWVWFLLAPLFLASLFSIVYSYVLFRAEQRG